MLQNGLRSQSSRYVVSQLCWLPGGKFGMERTYAASDPFARHHVASLGHDTRKPNRSRGKHTQPLRDTRLHILQLRNFQASDLLIFAKRTTHLRNKLSHRIRVRQQEERNTTQRRRRRLTPSKDQDRRMAHQLLEREPLIPQLDNTIQEVLPVLRNRNTGPHLLHRQLVMHALLDRQLARDAQLRRARAQPERRVSQRVQVRAEAEAAHDERDPRVHGIAREAAERLPERQVPDDVEGRVVVPRAGIEGRGAVGRQGRDALDQQVDVGLHERLLVAQRRLGEAV